MKILNKTISLRQIMPWLLVICGSIGLACSLIIMYDKVQLAGNPNFHPSCDLNPIISCGSVMSSPQGQAFGFPNPFIGIVGFSVVTTIGVDMLAGATFKKWFWRGLWGGTIFGVGFIHWLFFESVYRIQALCPYCMVVWVMTITLFWYTTLYLVQTGVIKLRGGAQKTSWWVRRHHFDIWLLWLLLIAFFILKHFWYYYGRHWHL